MTAFAVERGMCLTQLDTGDSMIKRPRLPAGVTRLAFPGEALVVAILFVAASAGER